MEQLVSHIIMSFVHTMSSSSYHIYIWLPTCVFSLLGRKLTPLLPLDLILGGTPLLSTALLASILLHGAPLGRRLHLA